MGKVAVRHP